MEFEIRDKNLQRLYEGEGDEDYPPGIGKLFRRRVRTISDAPDERVFRQLKSLHYEKLRGDRQHQRSMRLNKNLRLILEIEEGSDKRMIVVGIEDYH